MILPTPDLLRLPLRTGSPCEHLGELEFSIFDFRSSIFVLHLNNLPSKLVPKEQFSPMLRNIISGILMLISIVFLHACSDDEVQPVKETVPTHVITDAGRSIEIYDILTLRDLLNSNNDTLYLFNFWATWCQPCVKELPYFDMIDSAYSNKAVLVILISLDFVENTKSVLIPFLNANNVRSKVVLLDEKDGNTWMPDVDPSWNGAIPATLFRQRNNSNFRVHAFTYEELVQEVESFLNP